jgi:hypothetical protein
VCSLKNISRELTFIFNLEREVGFVTKNTKKFTTQQLTNVFDSLLLKGTVSRDGFGFL